MEAEAVDSGGSSVDLKLYARAVWRRKWWVLAVALVVFGATALLTMRQPRIYAASTSIVMDLTAPRFLDGQVQDVLNEERGNYWANREYTATQHRIIKSRAVAARVVEKLGLQADAAFLGLESLKDEKARAEAMARVDAVSLLQKKVTVTPEKETRIVHLQVEDLDAKRAALLANEMAEAYIAESLSLKLKATESASVWLEERLRELEQKSKSSELAVYDFKKDADVLTTSLENRLSIVSERLGAYNTALTEVRTKMAAIKARVEAINQLRKASGSDPRWAEALVGESVAVGKLRDSVLSTRTECIALAERYLEQHPALSACQEKLKFAEDELRRELGNVVKAAETQLAEAQANEKNLVALLDAAKQEAFEVNKKQIEFDRLQRDATNDQRLYDLVLKRLKDIELSGLLRTSNVRVLDSARPNLVPVRPAVAQNLIGALVAGLMLGVGLVILLEFLDSTVKVQSDVEERLGLSFLGLVPAIPEAKDAPLQERDLHVVRHPTSSVAECCRAIRTNLLFASPDRPFKTLVVTSSGPEEGKSTLAISLGVAMAQSGNRVLLVDTDMRRPRLHKALGVPNDVGVSSLVVQEGTLEKAIKSTEVADLFLLPCGPIPPNPAELLHTAAFKELLARLSERFDRIIFDSPPVNAVSDAMVLGAQVDGVLMVLKAHKTQRDLARRGLRMLRDVNARVVGGVLNAVDLSTTSYGGYGMSYLQGGYAYREPADAPARSA